MSIRWWYSQSIVTRADLHKLVDELPEDSLEPAAVILKRARSQLWAVLETAPLDDEPLTAEDIAAIEKGEAETGISLEEFRARTA